MASNMSSTRQCRVRDSLEVERQTSLDELRRRSMRLRTTRRRWPSAGALRQEYVPLLSAISLLVTMAACNQAEPPRSEEDPLGSYRLAKANVILLSIDTLRADRLSLYGYRRPTSPGLELFAQEAVVFDSFYYNGGGTLPSHMSMMTSLHPRTHWITPQNQRILEEERETLAEILSSHGYASAGFSDGGWMRSQFGFAQGFDRYDDEGGGFEAILPKARQWLDSALGRPLFLFIHTYDVHSKAEGLPYHCPGDFWSRYTKDLRVDFDGCKGERCATALLSWVNSKVRDEGLSPHRILSKDEIGYVSALYDGCINYADSQLSEFFEFLRQRGVYDRSLIVVTSDHGEEFAEHGMMIHDQGGFEELARIPLVVKLPRSQAGGTRVQSLAAMVDLLPTVLDCLGIPAPAQTQGFSLLPVIAGAESPRTDIHMYSVLRTRRWKYFSEEKRLYDLEADPRERTNVYHSEMSTVHKLEERVRGLIQIDIDEFDKFTASRSDANASINLSEEQLRELRALGYLE